MQNLSLTLPKPLMEWDLVSSPGRHAGLGRCSSIIPLTTYLMDPRGFLTRKMTCHNPINVYGLTKLHGEEAVRQAGGCYLILRTSWVYSLRRDNFVTKVMSWVNNQNELKIVDDQISSPTWARMLAETSAQIIAQGRGDPLGFLADKVGIFHHSRRGILFTV